MSQIKSHIQMPKFILRQFENDNHELFFYDFKDGKFKTGHADSLNTELGYYSEEMEKTLNNYVEHPFSVFLKKAKTFLEDNDVTINQEDKNAVFTYFFSLVTRGTEYLEIVKNESVTKFMFHPTVFHDYITDYGIARFSEFFKTDNAEITLCINTTEIPFILPNIGYCTLKGVHFLPITPVLAVMIIYENTERFFENGKLLYAKFDTNQSVESLNINLFLSEKNNNRYVTATSKKQLESIVEELRKNGKML